MNNRYTIIPAKSRFGKTYNAPYYTEYIKNKSVMTKFCPRLQCKTPVNRFMNQADYLSIKKVCSTNPGCCAVGYIDKTNLNINLLTKENLKYVNVIKYNATNASPTNINRSLPFLYNYTIDPSGQLFGNTGCGINNWTRYMVYNFCNTNN